MKTEATLSGIINYPLLGESEKRPKSSKSDGTIAKNTGSKGYHTIGSEKSVGSAMLYECRCSSGYGEQHCSHLTDVDASNMNIADEMGDVKKRFTTLEHRMETLEKQICERVEAKLLDGQWTEALANKTTIHGLKEVLTERHKLLRPSWILIFLTALGCTTYYTINVVKEFSDDPTATKVRLLRKPSYDYPVMLLCPDTWLDVDKALSLNLSEEGLQYALGYLINMLAHGGAYLKLIMSNMQSAHMFPRIIVYADSIDHIKSFSVPTPFYINDYNKSSEDFETWWYTSKNALQFANVAEFFKYIATDLNMTDNSTVETCSYCKDVKEKEQILAKILMNEGVCYNLSLAKADGRVSLGDLEQLSIQMPMRSRGYLYRKTYWKFVVNPDLSLAMSDTHYMQVFPNHSNTIRVMPHHFKSLRSGNCVTEEEVESRKYSQSSCVAKCFMNHAMNCTPVPLVSSESLPRNISKLCGTALFVSNSRPPLDDGEMKDTPPLCGDQCPAPCEKYVWESSVESHEIRGHEQGFTTFHFLNQVVHYGGILSHQEVLTYSFETLVSNVGGQLGLWLGASLMSLIELCMFSLNVCCDRKRRDRRKLQRSLDN